MPISPDYPFESKFVEVEGSRIHYVEQGEGDPILFLHGQPTWSYLWRNVIPHVSPQGRAIAMDLVGFGKSDRPDGLDYRFLDHARYVDGFIQALELENITLVIHDWGSALGFHYAARHPDNVKGIAFMEAVLAPVPSYEVMGERNAKTFRMLRDPDRGKTFIDDELGFIEKVLPRSIVRDLTEDEMAAYREPWLEGSRHPMVQWPREIPIAGDPPDVHDAVSGYYAWLQQTETPMLMITVDPGMIMAAPVAAAAQRFLKNVTVVDVGAGLHFVQEDNPDGIGQAVAEWYRGL